MDKRDCLTLIDLARGARGRSYSPYSGFSVGAALLCADGSVYTGANIENSSFTPTVCAERVALFNAVHDGKRDFVAIAITGAAQGEEPNSPCPPCGVCRQVMSEFCKESFTIILDGGEEILTYTLGELLPERFTFKK